MMVPSENVVFPSKPTNNFALALGNVPHGPSKGPMVDRYHSGESWHKPKGHKKSNIALSALTLLAFLFFLNILQSCLQDHMDGMKGKGQYGYGGYPWVYPQVNIQIPAIPGLPALPAIPGITARLQLQNIDKTKGDQADLSDYENTLETDDLTVEGASEEEVLKQRNRIKQRRRKPYKDNHSQGSDDKMLHKQEVVT